MLRIIVEAATKEIPRLMMAIREAVTGGNAAELQLAAHTLREQFATLLPANALNNSVASKRWGRTNLEGAQESLASLEAEVRLLTPALTDYLRQSQTEDNS